MLVRDIDRALDVRVVVRVKQDTELMRMAAELRMKLPVFIYSRSGQLWMSTYVRKQDLDSRLSMALRRMDCRETRDAYVVDERINNVEQMSVVQKLLEVPSFAMNRSDSMNGYVNIYARFHHSHINLVSEELVKFAGEDKVVLDWLGPSPGITRIMDRINQEYRVTLVSYRVPGGDELPVLTGNLGEVELLAETKSSVGDADGFQVILYSSRPISGGKGLEEIDGSTGLYHAYFRHRLLAEMRRQSNEMHIMRIVHFIRPVGSELEVNVFLPESEAHDYLKVVAGSAVEGRVTLLRYMQYESGVWDLL